MKKYIKANLPAYMGALICILISVATGTVLQFLKGDVLDFALAGDGSAALKTGIELLILILAETGFAFLYDLLSGRFITGCVGKLKRELFTGALDRDYADFVKLTKGEYLAKYTSEADMANELGFSSVTLFLLIASRVAFVSVALFILDWRIALITLVLLSTPLYVPKLIEKRLERAQKDYQSAVEANLKKVTDYIGSFEAIKNFSIEKAVYKRFDSSCRAMLDKLWARYKLSEVAHLITTLISYVSYFVILAFSAYLVFKGEITAGGFFVAIGMIDQLSYPLISMSALIRNFIAVKPVLASLETVISGGTAKRADAQRIVRGLELDNASFSYEGASEPALRRVSAEFKKNGRYLIRGQSGCGKTTLTNLLLGYYAPSEGSALIDGEDIAKFDMRGIVSVVRQDATLFNETLRDNLTIFSCAEDDKLNALLTRLGLEKLALDAPVSENGSNLSGGEKRRICLARALLRDTPIVIFDEPLANLDDENADIVEDILLGIEDRTVIIVSHRFTPDKLSRFSGVLDL